MGELGDEVRGRAERLRIAPTTIDRTRRVTRCEQHDFMPGLDQSTGQQIDDQLAAAIHRRRHRYPRRSDQADPQSPFRLT